MKKFSPIYMYYFAFLIFKATIFFSKLYMEKKNNNNVENELIVNFFSPFLLFFSFIKRGKKKSKKWK